MEKIEDWKGDSRFGIWRDWEKGESIWISNKRIMILRSQSEKSSIKMEKNWKFMNEDEIELIEWPHFADDDGNWWLSISYCLHFAATFESNMLIDGLVFYMFCSLANKGTYDGVHSEKK